jgi:D-alanyl-D-alanine carboxypeptidase
MHPPPAERPLARRRVLQAAVWSALLPTLPAACAAPDPRASLDALVGPSAVAAIGLATGPQIQWRGAAGEADRDRAQPARHDVDYQFRIGSATKTFTATVVLQLVEEGALELDAAVGRYLPALVPHDVGLTVQHLLTMTSGIPDFVVGRTPSFATTTPLHREFAAATAAPLDPAERVAAALAGGLRFTPGSRFDYSTTNYLVLGMLVEQATGTTFATELRRRIIDPLGLHRTALPDGVQLDPPHLHGYAQFSDRPEEWTDVTERHEPGGAGGGLVSTLPDLAAFLAGLLGGRLLGPRTLAIMQTPSSAPSAAGAAPPGAPSGTNYGMGLLRFDRYASEPMWGHGGTTVGYTCTALSTPDGRWQVAAASTTFPARSPQPPDAFDPLVRALVATRG